VFQMIAEEPDTAKEGNLDVECTNMVFTGKTGSALGKRGKLRGGGGGVWGGKFQI